MLARPHMPIGMQYKVVLRQTAHKHRQVTTHPVMLSDAQRMEHATADTA